MSISATRVELGDRSYEISIGPGLVGNPSVLKSSGIEGRTVFVVTDENVALHYEECFEKALLEAGVERVLIRVIEPGERSKNFTELGDTLNWMLDNLPDRRSVVAALGGGVVGDLAGLAAALLLRGVPYMQVPTSLLAQIDSSIGGKTAVDMPRGKNLVGRFYQPMAVVADIATLETLPDRQMRAGYAEGVKHAVIKDRKFFEWLQENGGDVIAADPESAAKFVEWNCRIKKEAVQADENDLNNTRALLNFGHTFGHALEAACGFDASLLHGEAVSIGTVLAMTLSCRMGLCPEEDLEEVRKHLDLSGLPVSISAIDPPLTTNADALIEKMLSDKKTLSGRINFILARGIGDAFATPDVDGGLLKQVIRDSMDGH